ncbi:arginine repressor [Jiangella mangrovi]|uniref:Arginine repressor n=1 Tax=Jiangella mangrovi TaxID=1524084 RepID=A0A7W9GWR2_9ACTN|nr:arginine repressor [Jiangella mangrovi]MBB5791449.1 transcriptional regulator of arginine metabolism [Jiangella mangrovi]
MTQPATRAARHGRIAEILAQTPIRSQTELAERLSESGIEVTQGTLSRDLDELGAVKIRGAGGSLVYALPGEGGDMRPRAAEEGAVDARLVRVCEEILVSARSSANLVVLRTPPGAAQYLASAIDHAAHAGLLGTIAGDDTVLVITTDPAGGERVAAWFLALAEGNVPAPPS